MKYTLFLLIILLNISFVAAENVAYIVKLESDAEQNIKDSITESGLTYKVILESDIGKTNFTNYNLLIIGKGSFSSANAEILSKAITENRAIIVNNKHFDGNENDEWGWSSTSGQTTQTIMKKNILEHDIFTGIGEEWIAYTASKTVYYLKGEKARGLNLLAYVSGHTSGDAVVATALPGVRYLNGNTEKSKSIFYGLTESAFWTQNSKKIFKNMIQWILEGIDADGDGYAIEEDCDDTNAQVHPGAPEIPYDGIDQDCSGFDSADVDGDNYCKEGYNIQNKSVQCPLEEGNQGTDCNDEDALINRGAQEIFDSINQNCINEPPVQLQDIPRLTWDEDTTLNIDMSVYFADPDGDKLNYDLSGVVHLRLTSDGDSVTIIPSPNFFGVQTGNFLVDDGDLQISSHDVVFEVRDVFDPDIIPPEVTLLEPPDGYRSEVDTVTFRFNAKDETADSLTCSFYSDVEGEFRAVDNNQFTMPSGVILTIILGSQNGIPDGTFQWNVQCSDGSNTAFAAENWTFTVDEDDAPIFNMEDKYTIAENSLLVITANAYDPDGKTITYSLSDPRFIQNENIFTWQTDFDDAGEFSFILRASDGTLESELEIHVVVTPVNRVPLFTGTIGNKNTDEDTAFEIDLRPYFSDPDNDPLDYSYRGGEHLRVTFNTGIATIAPEENWYGTTTIIFIGQDNEFTAESNSVTVFVNPLNDAPLLENIDEIVVREGELVQIIVLAHDADGDVLTYSLSDPRFIQNENIFTWQTDFDDAGEFSFIVNVSDGILSDEQTITLTVMNVNIPPVLDFIPDFTIEENSGLQEVWQLTASDQDGTIEDFGATSLGQVECIVEGDKLSIGPKNSDFFGKDLCIVRVRDNDGGTDEQTIGIHVTNIQDSPQIREQFPLENELDIPPNHVQNFYVLAHDADDDKLHYKWILDNEVQSTQSTYTFTAESVETTHTLVVTVTDGTASDERTWFIKVSENEGEEQVCNALGGTVCRENEICTGEFLNASDTTFCCTVSCMPSQEITIKDKCEKGHVGDLEITLKEPEDDEEFKPKEIVGIEAKVKNKGTKDLDIILEAILFDRDDNDSVKKEKTDDFEIEDKESTTVDLDMEVPNGEIDEDHDYTLLVKVYEEGNEKEQCDEDIIDIDIEREKNDVVITELSIEPDSVTCNQDIHTTVTLENIGKKSEDDVFVEVLIPSLNREEESGSFDLGDHEVDEQITKTLIIRIPETVKKGEYDLFITAFFDKGTQKVSEMRKITVQDCVDGKRHKEDLPQKIKKSPIVVDNIFNVEPGQEIKIPVLVKNTNNYVGIYTLRLSDTVFSEITELNVLLKGNTEREVTLKGKIKEDITSGEHSAVVTLLKGKNQEMSKNIVFKVHKPQGRSLRWPSPVITLFLFLVILSLFLIYYKRE